MGSHGIKDQVAIIGMGCTRFGERCPQGDGVVPRGQHETVATDRVEVLRIPSHLMEVKRRERVGDGEPLPHVALPRAARHDEHVPTHIPGPAPQCGNVGDVDDWFHGIHVNPCRVRH